MKRFLAILLILIFSLSFLTACGEKDEPDKPPQEEQTDKPKTTDDPHEDTPPEPQGNINPLTGLEDGISDEALARRPVAIMVSNSYDSLPQWGISRADIIYEMLAEGRITRFLAIFKDPSKIEKLASIRSARPYFIDIAQSYSAVYMHFGGSVPAYEAISARKDLISMDGIRGGWEGKLYFRDPDRRKQIGLEHSVYTTGEYIEENLASLKADLSQDEQPSAFTFGDENSASAGQAMSKVTITFSSRHMPYYTYDAAKGTYLRFQYGEPHMDALHDKQIEVKNLLVLRMKTVDLNNDLNLVDVKTTGSGKGYYFCEGKYVPITWEKSAYNSPISYYDEQGNTLTLSPGQTFVSVVTETASIDIE